MSRPNWRNLVVECAYCIHYKDNPYFRLSYGKPEKYCSALTSRVRLTGLVSEDVFPAVVTPPNGMCWMFARIPTQEEIDGLKNSV